MTGRNLVLNPIFANSFVKVIVIIITILNIKFMKRLILLLAGLIVFANLASQVIHHSKILDAIDRVADQEELSEQSSYFTINDVYRLRTVAETVISPDKKYIAFTLNVPRPFHHQPGGDYRELYLYEIASGKKQAFITGTSSVFSIGWTPDGKSVTFRASFPKAQGMQVYAMDLIGGEAYPLTQHPTSVRQYAFGDQNSLIFTAIEPEDDNRRAFRNQGFDIEIYEEEQRHISLYTHDLSLGETRRLTSGVTVFDFAVSPDGKQIAAAIAPNNLVDDSYMFKRIYLVDVASASFSQLLDNPGKLGKMAWSPDGKHLAFLSASHVHDAVVGSLFVIDLQNPEPFNALRNYMQNMRASAIDIGWKDRSTMLFASEEGVDIVLSEQKIGDAQRRILIEPAKVVFSSFDYNDGLVSFSGNTWQHPPEVYSFELRRLNLSKLTDHNSWLGSITLGNQEKIVYDGRDGLDIEGVLIYPVNYEAGKRYPLIVYIHGGPEAANQNGWNTYYSRWGQVAAGRDYFLFMPNYRAGSGRGVDFTMEGFADLVGKEYEDVLDGIDYLIEQGLVDENRVGIGGGSYGGYFSAWSSTKYSERFAASVVFVGIGNQVSKRNTTDIPWEDYLVHWGFWNHEDHEKVYDASPVKFAHLNQTPTLILHGKDDPRIPVSQGLELYRALKLHGAGPVRLILYPGEGHGNRKNTNRLEYIVRTMEWFDHYLKGSEKDEMPYKYPAKLLKN
jgi:dipeptidyl aminopeptidase/acylaminoacyl peptidase